MARPLGDAIGAALQFVEKPAADFAPRNPSSAVNSEKFRLGPSP